MNFGINVESFACIVFNESLHSSVQKVLQNKAIMQFRFLTELAEG